MSFTRLQTKEQGRFEELLSRDSVVLPKRGHAWLIE
jgi:hypothetical protein